MKISTLTSLFILASTCLSFSEDTPREVTRLEEQRTDAIRKIDQTFIQELEKIKSSLTKDAKLEAAVAVDARIKKIQKQLGDGADLYSTSNKVSESSIVGEYNYTYVSNGYREAWTFKDGGKVEFRSTGKSDIQGQWELRNNVLIVKKFDGVNLEFHFPLGSLVSSKIVGAKGAAIIEKK